MSHRPPLTLCCCCTNMLYISMTESQPSINCGPHPQLLYEKVHLCMLMVSNADTENFKHFKNFCGMCKELDISPLCHKFAYGHQTVVEGQGHFAQSL